MNQNLITPKFDSTLSVFAELVSEERLARKNYFAKCKAQRQEDKKNALQELKSAESKVDEMLHAIINKPHADLRRVNVGGGRVFSTL